ncbi:hypothetical protein NXX53_19635 [Bacteroides salyersiae]|nr:hypothetical protein [Bacteroides salyersiae]
MILALAAIIVYFVADDFKIFIYVCGAAIFVKADGVFYTIHQQIRRTSYD